MPLDGLRAWIGEVERKLGMRTRVFLVLATIAIGGAGAAIYLALDTREDAVSEGDVRELQDRLEEQIATGGTGGAALSGLEAKVQALEAEVDQLRDGDRAAGASSPGAGDAADPGPSGSADSGPADAAGDGADAAGSGSDTSGIDTKAEAEAKLEELAEQARESAEAEAGQGAGLDP